MILPDEATLAWLEAAVGTFRVVDRFAYDHAYSQLWRLQTVEGHVWLRCHATARKWGGELYALTQWGPESGRTPRVIAFRETPCALLLTEMPGFNPETLDLEGPAEERMWSEAGVWLRRMHARTNLWLGDVRPDGTPFGSLTTDTETHVRAQIERWLTEGKEHGLLDAAEVDFVESRARAGLPSLTNELAVSIHRDFTPRNWLASPDGGLTAVIDFEHARWDVRAADLNRPWDHEFFRNPRLIDAFYEAYGHPDVRFLAQIQTLRLLNLLGATVWGLRTNEREYSERSRAALHRIMESP